MGATRLCMPLHLTTTMIFPGLLFFSPRDPNIAPPTSLNHSPLIPFLHLSKHYPPKQLEN